jgi:flagellar biosynthetic protein FliP
MLKPFRKAIAIAAFAAVGVALAAGSAAALSNSTASVAPAPESTATVTIGVSAAGYNTDSPFGIGQDIAPGPTSPTPATKASTGTSVSINLGGALSKPSQSLVIIIALTLLTVAPTLLIMMTSFTRIIIVLSLTRQALGLTTVPPNQVLAGLALFLSLFIMAPTITAMNHDAVQPWLNGKITTTKAYNEAQIPLRTWMEGQTRTSDLAIFVNQSGKLPKNKNDVPMSALIPAFILSELKTAMIIGFVIFIPFLVIDLLVSSSLMSMGMMMLPPTTVSLPFKILLFVLVDGWGLVTRSLLASFHH